MMRNRILRANRVFRRRRRKFTIYGDVVSQIASSVEIEKCNVGNNVPKSLLRNRKSNACTEDDNATMFINHLHQHVYNLS
jgi:hypothetical protein